MERLADADARNICVIKPSALGDIVQTLPLLPALRSRFPDSRISWIVKQQFAEILDGHPLLDDVLPVEMRRGPGYWMSLLGDVRRRKFDLVLDLQGLFRTGVMTMASGAPLRVGLETAREGAGWATNCVIPGTSKQLPAHARYWRVAECLGVGSTSYQTDVWLSEEDQEWARTTRSRLREPVVAMHCGAAWATKQWPVEKFASLAYRVQATYDASILLIGTATEQPLVDRLKRLMRRDNRQCYVIDLTGQTSLKRLAAILAEVDVLVSNDSGPMHLAAGMGTPVLGLFTCTSPDRSGPPGHQHALVSSNLDCAASYRKQCPHQGGRHLLCLDELDVDRAWIAFQQLAATWDGC